MFVNVKHGDDANFGGTPERAVQTITRALEIAAFNLTIPWTIRVAGAVDRDGIVLAYDDDAGTVPPSRECFPLSMLPGVSLVWDQDNSDVVPTGPDGEEFDFVRPLVRTVFGAGVLVEFSPHALPGGVCSPVVQAFEPTGARVTLSGLDFEGGDPTISIRDNPREPVSVMLKDVAVRTRGNGVEALASAFEIALEIRRSRFELLPLAPYAVPQPTLPLDFRATDTGVLRIALLDCEFETYRGPGAGPMVQFRAEPGALIQGEVRNCSFKSQPPGPIAEKDRPADLEVPLETPRRPGFEDITIP